MKRSLRSWLWRVPIDQEIDDELALHVEMRTRDLVIASAARVVATGAALGLVLSALGGRLIQTMLFGVRPLDPATFVLVTVVLFATAALSIAAPAWRAIRIDPAVALRNS